jgi:hypothetical protein
MRSGPIEWISLALICGCAVLSALLELMIVPLYVGSVLLPVAVVAAVVSNLLLPLWGLRVIGTATGAILPFVCWLVVILMLSLVNRPEGDLFVTATHGQQYNFYGLLLFGSIAGFGVIVRFAPVRTRIDRPSPSGRTSGGGSGKNRSVSR